MQYVYGINNSFTVTSLLDLPMLRDILEACNLKPHYSLLGRELGYSRYRLAKVTFNRTTETLQDALVEFFEQLQGIPHVLVTDTMKTMMAQPS